MKFDPVICRTLILIRIFMTIIMEKTVWMTFVYLRMEKEIAKSVFAVISLITIKVITYETGISTMYVVHFGTHNNATKPRQKLSDDDITFGDV